MVKKDILLDGVVVGSHDATGDNLKDAQAVEDFFRSSNLQGCHIHNYGKAGFIHEDANL